MRFNSTRRLFLVAWALAGIAGVIFALSLLQDGRRVSQPSGYAHGVDGTRAKVEATVTATIANLFDIPLYPGVRGMVGDPLNATVDPHMYSEFGTVAPTNDVLEFYEKALLAKGWLRDHKQLGYPPPEDFRQFRWFDSSGVNPYILAISVQITRYDGGYPLVRIRRDREVDIYNLPVFPDANDVKVTDVQPFTSTEHIRSITTTFRTSADKEHIEAYYVDTMTGIGCSSLTPDGHTSVKTPSELPALEFGCGFLRGTDSRLLTITVEITPHEEQPTDVKVNAFGVGQVDRDRK